MYADFVAGGRSLQRYGRRNRKGSILFDLQLASPSSPKLEIIEWRNAGKYQTTDQCEINHRLGVSRNGSNVIMKSSWNPFTKHHN
jgi:hypothetical protein